MNEDKYDALIVEFFVEAGSRNEADNPADALKVALEKEKIPFEIDELEFSRQEVLDDPRSIIFDQAENRLHVQKAILAFLAKAAKPKR